MVEVLVVGAVALVSLTAGVVLTVWVIRRAVREVLGGELADVDMRRRMARWRHPAGKGRRNTNPGIGGQRDRNSEGE